MPFNFMPALLETAHRITCGMLGDRITVTDLAGVSIEIDATLGNQLQEVIASDVVQVAYDQLDFIVLAADLRFAGVQAEPQRGWKIRRRAPQGLITYEVLPPSGTGDVFRYSNPARTLIRMHARHVLTET